MYLINKTFKLKNIELKSRIVMPPMANFNSDEADGVNEKLINYYDEKAKNNYLGLIITEHSYVNKEGKAHRGQLSMSKDRDIEGFKKLVEVIHKNNSKCIAQISHAGSCTNEDITGSKAYSASSVKHPGAMNHGKGLPKEMTEEDIKNLINDFVNAAVRAEKAGFDGVELHGAPGYLLDQFYSPLTNKRKDKYTGSTLDGRIQLHLEIIKAIRKKVRKDFILAVRLGASDYMEGGTVIEDSVYASKRFEEAGVDLIDVSGGMCGADNPFNKEEGYFSELSMAIKKEVSVPVILTGGIKTPEAAEKLLSEGRADLIGVGRAILKNDSWWKNI